MAAGPPPTGTVVITSRDPDADQVVPCRVVLQRLGRVKMPPKVRDSGGELSLTLPRGRYRVTVFHGLEWTAAEEEIEVVEGTLRVAVTLRHVVEPGFWIGADLHVHAKASFDSLMSYETRERSLTATGVEVAVASDHDVSSAPVSKGALGWIGGVEITRKYGHLNVFPYDIAPPPKRLRTLHEITDDIRARTPASIVQVNHPRLRGMGLFTLLHISPSRPDSLTALPRQVSHLEVFNGHDTRAKTTRANVDEWLALWEAGRPMWATGGSDAHKLSRPTPGFPRTYVPCLPVPDRSTCKTGIWLQTMLASGKAFVTSGPFIELAQDGAWPGGPLVVTDGRAKVQVRVRAAPFVAADELVVLVGGKEVLRRDLPPRALSLGGASGTLAEARKATVLFDGEIDVPVATGAKTLVVVVRGRQSLRTLLPTLDIEPFAFTNPLVVEPQP